MKRFTFLLLIVTGIAAFLAAETTDIGSFRQEGIASWYGSEFAGKPTASGEIFNPSLFTAAHPTLPMNTILTVTNKQNNRRVTVRVNDRGPFAAARIIDLSMAAAGVLDMITTGTAPVIVEMADSSVLGPTEKAPSREIADNFSGAVEAQVPAAPAAAVRADIVPVAPPAAVTPPAPVVPVAEAVPVPPPAPAAPMPEAAPVPPAVTSVPVTQAAPAARPLPPAPVNFAAPLAPLPPARIPPARIMGGIPQAGSAGLYRIQVGAYTIPRNAVDAFEKLKSAGLNPAYEKHGDYYRVVLAALKAADIPAVAQKLGEAGFSEALIRGE